MRIALTLDRDADLSETNDYLRSLVAAGVPREAIDVVTPLSPASRPFDALVLGGGVDVDPARYGSRCSRTAASRWMPSARDRLPSAGRSAAVGRPGPRNLPRLQVVNVALGGTLVQDIPTERPSRSSRAQQGGKDAARSPRVHRAGDAARGIAGVPRRGQQPPLTRRSAARARARGVGAAPTGCRRRSRRPARLAGRRPVAPENLGGDPVSGVSSRSSCARPGARRCASPEGNFAAPRCCPVSRTPIPEIEFPKECVA
jgi:hypothetical protein